MGPWLDEEEIKICLACRGPILERRDPSGEMYIIPVDTRAVRIDVENEVLWDRLQRAEKIIVMLRNKVRELESRPAN